MGISVLIYKDLQYLTMIMFNLHKAKQVAKYIGRTVPEIYGIITWGAMQKSPLNDPDIVKEFFANLPLDKFGPHLKINRLWYNSFKAELWNRHKKAEKAYNIAEEEYWEAGKKFAHICDTNPSEYVAYEKAYKKAYIKRGDTFEKQVRIEEALLQCGFISHETDEEKLTQMQYNKNVLPIYLTYNTSIIDYIGRMRGLIL